MNGKRKLALSLELQRIHKKIMELGNSIDELRRIVENQ